MTTHRAGRDFGFSASLAARQILSNAGSMFGTTLATSLLGFAFWGVAARLASPSSVGEASASISAMQLIATFGTLGLGTLLIAELGGHCGCRKTMIMTCLWIAAVISGLAGLGYCWVFDHIRTEPGAIYDSWAGAALFSLATALTAAAMVLDGGLIGLLKSRIQLWRNTIASAVKLLLVPLGLVTSIGIATGLFLWWFLGSLASLGYVVLIACRPLSWLKTRPSPVGLKGFGRLAAGHHWINVSTQVPRLLLPVMVSVQLSNGANAAFYAALLLAGFIWIVPNHIATAMFAVNAHDPSTLGSELVRMWRLCRFYALAATVIVAALAQPLLEIFGPTYVQARWALVSFASVTLTAAVKSLYIAVRRAQGQLRNAALATCTGTALELILGEIGLAADGITGVALGMALAMICETFGYWPVVRRAMTTRHTTPRTAGGRHAIRHWKHGRFWV